MSAICRVCGNPIGLGAVSGCCSKKCNDSIDRKWGLWKKVKASMMTVFILLAAYAVVVMVMGLAKAETIVEKPQFSFKIHHCMDKEVAVAVSLTLAQEGLPAANAMMEREKSCSFENVMFDIVSLVKAWGLGEMLVVVNEVHIWGRTDSQSYSIWTANK